MIDFRFTYDEESGIWELKNQQTGEVVECADPVPLFNKMVDDVAYDTTQLVTSRRRQIRVLPSI